MSYQKWNEAVIAMGMLCAGLRLATAEEPASRFVSPITVEQIRPHVELLAGPEYRGRAGTDAQRTAHFLVGRFREAGLRPLFPNGQYEQPIPGHVDRDGPPRTIGRNVGGWIEGSDHQLKNEFVILGVHYDHLGLRDGEIYAGADDNATGVAMMLEVARTLAALPQPPRRSVVFLGFDLEEHMLWGSRWFVAHPPWPISQVKFFMTADMIGRSLGDLPLPVVFVMGSEHAAGLGKALDQIGQPGDVEIARLGIDLVGTRSDYGPFRDKQIPFLFLSTGQHPDYHTPRDVPSKVDYGKAANIAGLALRIVQSVADAPESPRWTNDVALTLDEPRALERITTLLLEAEHADRPLTDVQRYLVSTVQARTKRIIDRGTLTLDDRTWLTRMSQLLLLSVF